jgi:hypothetical protein
MTYNKLPGGYANGMEKKDFPKKEQQAIDKGSKIESEEHGKTASKEIAADHVAEHGSVYYNDKKGLPAMEAKLEKNVDTGKPIPYDPQKPLNPAGHLAQSRLHNKHGQIAGASGDPISAQWHYKQASYHWKAVGGPVKDYKPEPDAYVINTKSEKPMVHEPSLQKKSVKYASGELSKSIKSDCPECNCKRHNQWVDSAKKSESCKKCGTPLHKASKLPEDMPDEVRMLSKTQNAVNAMESEELQKEDSMFDKGVSSIKSAFGGGNSAPAPAPAPAPTTTVGGSGSGSLNEAGVKSIKNAFGG